MRLLPVLLLSGLACLALASEPRLLNWSELIPPDAPPQPLQIQPLHGLEQLAAELGEQAPAATQQGIDAPVVKALHGQHIKLPGYIVPLDIDEQNRVSEFLLVPFFGACIHVPPPPSNQIVHVRSEPGVMLNDLYQPFWIEGALSVESIDSELAQAGYQMHAEKIYPYEL